MTTRPKRKGLSLRLRIMLLVDLVLIVTVALTVAATTYQADRALKREWEAQAEAKGHLLIRTIAASLKVPDQVQAALEDQIVAQAKMTAQLVAVAERINLPRELINGVLSDIADLSIIDEFLITDESAHVVLSNTGADFTFSPDPNLQPEFSRFFPLLNQQADNIVHEAESVQLGKVLLYAGVPGVDEHRIVLVGHQMSFLDELDRFYGENLVKDLIGEADVQYIRLVDADLNTVALEEGANAPQIENAEAKEAGDIAQAMAGASPMFRWEPEALVVTTPLFDVDGKTVAGAAVVHISTANLQQIRQEAVRGGLALGGLMFVLGSVVSYWMAGRIARPLQEMADLAREVADGDLSHDIQVRHSAELGQLESALAQMTDNLRATIQRIRQSARQVGGSAGDINAVVGRLNETVSQQSAAVAETTAAMEELRAVSGQIADGALIADRSATQTQGDVHAGLQAVAEAVARMEEIRAGNEASVSEILALGQKARQIGAVMDLIEDIAAQTKLISINASIEAATAGEAGERFNVVAGQVRSLAENVGRSTEEIRQRIREIQIATNELIIAAEQNTKKIDQGVALSQTAQATLDQIAASADQTTLSASQISISTRQQQTAVEQVVEALHNLNEEVSRVAASSGQTAQVVADLGHLASALNQLVALFDLGDVKRDT